MNALPVGPQGLLDTQARSAYFADLERWGFDIPYNAYYAATYKQVVVDYKSAKTHPGQHALEDQISSLCSRTKS